MAPLPLSGDKTSWDRVPIYGNEASHGTEYTERGERAGDFFASDSLRGFFLLISPALVPLCIIRYIVCADLCVVLLSL